MKNSIKNKILDYLSEKKQWIFGGQIDDFIRQTDGHKASNCSRRCRELENEGKIERRLVRHEGLNVVQYRIKSHVMATGTILYAPVRISSFASGYCCGNKIKHLEDHSKDCPLRVKEVAKGGLW